MLDMLREFGWIVVEVEDLPALASLVRGVGVVLIRSGASGEEIARVVDRVLLDRVPPPRMPLP